MTYPPQGSDEPGRDEGAPTPQPGPPPQWGQEPQYEPPPQPYGRQPQYGQPFYGPPSQYGPPQSYGQPPPYGPQPYGAAQYDPGQAPYGAAPYGAPPYGAPGQQFGPPPAAPAPKSKVGLIAILTGVALLVIAGAVVLVLSLQSTVLDAASAERDVAAQFEQREGVSVDLNCPNDMKVTAGATYTCTGKTANGESVRIKLAITNAKTAAYTWTEP
jgi:uncharacterized membrane protein